MSAPDLTPTLRAALDAVLAGDVPSLEEYDALVALRDACPEPRWLPTGDGLAVRVIRGLRSVYYVRDGMVSRTLRQDGTLAHPLDPAMPGCTWEPFSEVTR